MGYVDNLMSLQQMRSGAVCIDQHMKNPPKLHGFGGLL